MLSKQNKNNSKIPEKIRLEKSKNSGVCLLKWTENLKAGLYEYTLSFSNPGVPVALRLLVNGREAGKYRVYYEKMPSLKTTDHNFVFFSEKNGDSQFIIELALMPGVKTAEFILTKTALKKLRYPLPSVWEREFPGRVMLDMWGWHVSPFHCRTMTVRRDYFEKRVIEESKKWGANFVQIFPYTMGKTFKGSTQKNYIDFCKDFWDKKDIREFISFCHKNGFFYEEHGFPPCFPEGDRFNRSEKTYEHIEEWMRQNADSLQYRKEEIADGFEVEEYADYIAGPQRGDGIFTSNFRTRALSAFLWSFNPGAYISLCAHIPNSEAGERIPAFHNLYELERGPNFVYVRCNAGWGNDNIFPLRLFPGQKGFHNPCARVFIGFQSDSRPFFWHALYGGRSYPDWFLEEANHFFRPRWREKEPCESTIYWLGEGDAVLPEEVRDYVYAVSMDPIRAAVTANLTTTGRGGFLRNLSAVGATKETKAKYKSPNRGYTHLFKNLNSEYRVNYPSTTSFIQNRFFRIYSGAHGGCSLEYDLQNTAQFSSYGARVPLFNNFLTTIWKKADIEEWLELRQISAERYKANLEEGSYVLKVYANRTLTAPANIYCEGRPLACLESGNSRAQWQIFFSVYGKGEREFTISSDNKESPDVSCCFRKNTLTKTSLWSIGNRQGRTCSFRGPDNIEQIDCNIHENPERIIPPRFGEEGKVKSINLLFKGEGIGGYDLVLGVRALRKAKLKVSVNQFSYLKNNSRKKKGIIKKGDFSQKEYDGDPFALPWAGEADIKADGLWHQVSFPISLISNNTNHLTLYCDRGTVEFSGMELVRTPVTHVHLLLGGNKAVLEESRVSEGEGMTIEELSGWEVLNDSPVFMWETVRKLERESKIGEILITSLDLSFYTDIDVNGKMLRIDEVISKPISEVKIVDKRKLLPTVTLHFLKKGSIYQIRKTKNSLEFISRLRDKEEIKAQVYIGFEHSGKKLKDIFTAHQNSEFEVCFGRKDKIKVLPEEKHPAVKLIKIIDPGSGGYYIKEKGWWLYRGTQLVTTPGKTRQHLRDFNKWAVKGEGTKTAPVKESDYAYLKTYYDGKANIEIQRSGYINELVRPLPGCQYLLALGKVKKDSCLVRVMNTTAYLFAPGVEWKQPFTQVWLNGKSWHYFHEGAVYLPQRAGTYQVKVANKGRITPSISRTAACVKKTSWINGELSLETCLPDYVKKLPPNFYYRAMISYDRDRFVVKDLSGCILEKPGKLGDVIAFKPENFKISFLEIKSAE